MRGVICKGCRGPIEHTRPRCNYCSSCDKAGGYGGELKDMKEHWIVQKTPILNTKGVPTKAAPTTGAKCYASEDEALTVARSLVAKEGHKFHFCVYKSVAVVGPVTPVIDVRRMEPWHEADTECEDKECPLLSCAKANRPNRYSCKENNCEDTECRRCFPTRG